MEGLRQMRCDPRANERRLDAQLEEAQLLQCQVWRGCPMGSCPGEHPGCEERRCVVRSSREIVDQTNELARKLYALRGYVVAEGFRFETAKHPHQREAWAGACEAQLLLTETDPDDALQELEEEGGAA